MRRDGVEKWVAKALRRRFSTMLRGAQA